MKGHVILSSLMFEKIKGFVQTVEEIMGNSHSINVSILK